MCGDIKAFLLDYSVIRHVPLVRGRLRYHFLKIAHVITT